ncbi:cation:proton antiporter [Antarcticibacterium flavum]|uniref:Cation:proton antiporter n=1 Tax=Antarcticibacterium flavum TaxID=2058175 RepID=A0A5B7X2B2_9FLAO|nr:MULTISPECIES: cation:proton antiporter [Antarcticibacterium]MCM4160079.1 sodium:proton antiporter [Antarcticibacterium sp. W02-3]QCY69636.1 cation:proton antiporter [Antarcticibacterium flavum]
MNEFLEILYHEFELPLSNPVLVFSLILLIILISPILFRRINIPGIIVLIISGIIIGPFGVGLLEQNAAIDLFSKIGLLYIMFIAGLELDMNQFKVNRNKSFTFGFFTFILPLAIGFPVCFYLLGYDFNASFLTASMFATHTLISYPIVSKMGVSKNEAVAITVGGTILTDTAVLIILAVIMGNAQEGGLTYDFWVRLVISLSIFVAIMFFIVPRIAKWFFTTMEKEKHSHYIFVLTVVFLAAFMAELAGVEDIIGAFLAGLALNRLIPHSSALMNRIEFMGNSLFIPFFLISVGMLVDIRVIFSGYMAILVAITLSVVAIAGKWLAAFFTQLVYKYTASQRKVIFGLSSGHAAATLAVIIVGYNAGIIDINILNGTIILILITSIVATLATENAAKNMLAEAKEVDPEEIKKSESFKMESILLPLANMVNLEDLLEFAVLIKDKSSENPVSILTVVPNDEQAELNIAQARTRLEDFVKQASATETSVDVTATIDKDIASGISRKSKELIADFLVMGWPTSSGDEVVIGDKMAGIINKTPKTVFLCRVERPWATHQKLILAVPPNSEKMESFELWVKKVIKIAEELSVPILVNCGKETQAAIEELVDKLNLRAPFEFNEFTDWEDFLIISKNIQPEDIVMLITARKGSIAHQPILDKIPIKLENYFRENTKIMVFPQ